MLGRRCVRTQLGVLALVAVQPDDGQAQFMLGTVQFFQAIEGLSQTLYRHGVWAIFAGFDLSVLQWKPGLLVDDAWCGEVLDRLDAALAELSG